MARAPGGANDMHPLSWGGGGAQTEKIRSLIDMGAKEVGYKFFKFLRLT